MEHYTSGIDRPVGPDEAARLGRLRDQFEELVLQVWACEKEWLLDDRIDLALGLRRYRH